MLQQLPSQPSQHGHAVFAGAFGALIAENGRAQTATAANVRKIIFILGFTSFQSFTHSNRCSLPVVAASNGGHAPIPHEFVLPARAAGANMRRTPRPNAFAPAMTTALPLPPAEVVRTPGSEFWRKFRRQRVALAAGMFLVLLLVAAVFAPALAPFDAENFFDYDALNDAPSAKHWFGVDALGRDIFSRVLVGSRISLTAGLVSVLLGSAFGAGLGLLAGYYEGWIGRLVMRFSDVLFAFPGILLAIGIVAVLGNGMGNVIVAVAIFSVPTSARLVRGNVLALKQLTYIEAQHSIGAPDWSIVLRHLLPGTIPTLVVYVTMRIGTSIITAASLSFLGLGAQPPAPEWGAMLNEARSDFMNAPHVALFPSLAIFFTVLAFNLLGDGLRDALDPKLDQR